MPGMNFQTRCSEIIWIIKFFLLQNEVLSDLLLDIFENWSYMTHDSKDTVTISAG